MSFALVRFIPVQSNVPFIKGRFIAFIFSALLILGSLGVFFTQGLNYGIDFRGGTMLEVRTEGPADLSAIRTTMAGLGLGDVQVQGVGTDRDLFIRVESLSLDQIRQIAPDLVTEDTGENGAQQIVRQYVENALVENFPGIELRGSSVISPKVSDELVVKGSMAVGIALILMLIYIWFRFEWQYSVGAVLALVHDVIATIGMFSLTGLEFNLSTIAAILTIVGYSMNDTVVVYDRVREEFRKYKTLEISEVLNMSINLTLSRTILTSGTTLVALVSLAIFGGHALQGFAFALIWGIVIGTYSSIFVAAPLLMLTGVKRTSDEDEAEARFADKS